MVEHGPARRSTGPAHRTGCTGPAHRVAPVRCAGPGTGPVRRRQKFPQNSGFPQIFGGNPRTGPARRKTSAPVFRRAGPVSSVSVAGSAENTRFRFRFRYIYPRGGGRFWCAGTGLDVRGIFAESLGFRTRVNLIWRRIHVVVDSSEEEDTCCARLQSLNLWGFGTRVNLCLMFSP
jgi:hypothetical protein